MSKSLNTMLKELDEASRIEKLIGHKDLSREDVKFLKERAEKAVPRFEFLYGFYLLLNLEQKKEADIWFNKAFKHANGIALWYASGKFAFAADYLQDDFYIDWSMRCLRRSAWHQFPLAKMMLQEMKEHPYERKYPQA